MAFESEASNLVAGDTNGQVGIFVANLQLQEQQATATPAPVIGSGTGLRGDYFNNTSLSGPPPSSGSTARWPSPGATARRPRGER